MEKIEDYVAMLTDTGNGYSFADGKTCQYGEILKAIAVISNEHIKSVFYEMSQKQYYVSCMEEAEQSAPDKEDEFHIPTDEELLRYPRPEFMGREHTVSYGLSDKLKISIGNDVLKFVANVVRIELYSIHRRFIDSADGAVPECFKDEEFVDFIEHLLLEKVVDETRVNQYFGKFEISYVPLFIEKCVYKVYTIKTLAQIIAIEIINVRNSSIKYKKCPICKQLFIDGNGRGEARKYCDYAYEDEICSDEGQKQNEENKPEIKKFYKKFYDKVRKYYYYHEEAICYGKKKNEVTPWELELSLYHQELLEQNLEYEEHKRHLEEWYSDKRKNVKKKK